MSDKDAREDSHHVLKGSLQGIRRAADPFSEIWLAYWYGPNLAQRDGTSASVRLRQEKAERGISRVWLGPHW